MRWQGGRNRTGRGYILIERTVEGRRERQYEHIVVAEKALGKPLPPKVVVHHHDEDLANNANTNLVICEDQKYHKLLHARIGVIRAGGDPDRQKVCCVCHSLLSKEDFFRHRHHWDGRDSACKECFTRALKLSKQRRKERIDVHNAQSPVLPQ